MLRPALPSALPRRPRSGTRTAPEDRRRDQRGVGLFGDGLASNVGTGDLGDDVVAWLDGDELGVHTRRLSEHGDLPALVAQEQAHDHTVLTGG